MAGNDRGFTLVEVLIAAMLLMVALAAMSQLVAVTIVQHSDARRRGDSARQAQRKLDELMKLDLTTAAAVQVTGVNSLAANTANYFDTPAPRVTRRWVVTAGPVANTRTVTVRVINENVSKPGAVRELDLTSVIRQW